jgi:hypothetical protein
MAGITALLNVNVFDGTGHEPYAPGAIVIDGQRIQAIGPVSRVSIRVMHRCSTWLVRPRCPA